MNGMKHVFCPEVDLAIDQIRCYKEHGRNYFSISNKLSSFKGCFTVFYNQWIEDIFCVRDGLDGRWMTQSPIVVRLDYYDLFFLRKEKNIEILVGAVNTNGHPFVFWSPRMWDIDNYQPRYKWVSHSSGINIRGSKLSSIDLCKQDKYFVGCEIVTSCSKKIKITCNELIVA